MQLVISNPKTSKAYSKKIEDTAAFMNKRIGEAVSLDSVGMEGYEARITGGSDKTGTPMRFDLQGTMRKKVLLAGKPCFHPERKGERKRISVRGNTVAEDIHQLNLVLTKDGAKPLEELFPKEGEKKEEKKESIKEKMVKESLESVGKIGAEEAKKIKGKTKK